MLILIKRRERDLTFQKDSTRSSSDSSQGSGTRADDVLRGDFGALHELWRLLSSRISVEGGHFGYQEKALDPLNP